MREPGFHELIAPRAETHDFPEQGNEPNQPKMWVYKDTCFQREPWVKGSISIYFPEVVVNILPVCQFQASCA